MAPAAVLRSSHSSIAAPRDWLYLTSDRRLAPLPFPVARQHAPGDGGGKMTLQGSVGVASTQNEQSSVLLV
jgi:hypothetical protein